MLRGPTTIDGQELEAIISGHSAGSYDNINAMMINQEMLFNTVPSYSNRAGGNNENR